MYNRYSAHLDLTVWARRSLSGYDEPAIGGKCR
jgi:hypothetical protein